MREQFRFDVYNGIIIALIPFVLLVAWGLTWGYERNLRARQCDEAITYLEEVAEFSTLYTDAGSLDRADGWLDNVQTMSPPEPMSDLHNGAIAAITWATTTDMDVDTSEPAGLYERLTTFKDVLDEGRATLVKRCPDADALVPAAFPMYFREEGS
jgi:hypothetical protein